VSQILADLTLAVSKTKSNDEQQELVKGALDRLRPLYTQSKHLFTGEILRQIQDFKRCLVLRSDPPVPKPPYSRPPAEHNSAAGVEGVVLPPFVTVSAILRGVGNAIRQAFPTKLWIKGEVSEYKRAATGHHYFSLVERTAGGTQKVLPSAIWKNGWDQLEGKLRSAGVGIVSGQEMLFFGSVSLYESGGKLQFNVSDVLPEFTLGQIEMQRRAVLLRLQKEGLTELNKRHRFPDLPLRVALVSSRDSDGMRDFSQTIKKSTYPFQVTLVEVSVQGPNVEQSVCRALEVLALSNGKLKLDVVCIVRGGGSATDLGWWNNYAICAAIAKMPLPVVTGIGHERDRVAADEVAHTASATPTAAAELLCRTVHAAELELMAATETIKDVARRRIDDQRDSLNASIRSLTDQTGFVVAAQYRHASSLRDQLLAHARRALGSHANRLSATVTLVSEEPIDVVEALNLKLGTLSKQVAISSTINLKKAVSESDNLTDQLLAHARRALDPHASLLTARLRIVAVEPTRVVLTLDRFLGTVSQQVTLSSTTTIKQAVSRNEAAANQIVAHARRGIAPHTALLTACARTVREEPSRVIRSLDRFLGELSNEIAASSSTRLNAARKQSGDLTHAVFPLVTLHLRIADKKLLQMLDSILAGFGAALRSEEARIHHLGDLVAAHDPESVLRRGFSLTLDEEGRAVKDAALVEIGTTIMTKLGHGQLRSTVTTKE
jgi:exodeoxyribonuclease VII large subunit